MSRLSHLLVGGQRLTRKTHTARRLASVGVTLMLLGVMAGPVVGATTVPALWSAGGLSAGTDSAGQAARIASDASGNIAVVSGPALARSLAVTSYTPTGELRWQRTVSPSVGTFRGDWVVAAPNGDFAAVGTNVDSHGYPIGLTMVRYASDGTLLWRVDLARWRPWVGRLIADGAGNTFLVFSSIGDGQDIQLHKYDSSGVLLWSQLVSTGYFANDIATSLALSPDGADVVLTGDISGGAEWITAAYSAATGVRRWLVTAPEGIAALDVVVDATRVYVTGQGSVGIYGFLTVVAYDRATGARAWRRDSNPSVCCAMGARIALAPDGSLIVAGQTSSGGYIDWWIVAMDTSGTVKWQARRDRAVSGDEIPTAVFVLADGTTVVSGIGGPVTRDILGNSYMQGVTAGYSTNGTLLWEGFSKMGTVWAVALPNDDVCATGGYDALVTCWRVPGVAGTQPPPTAPSGLTASLSGALVQLSWQDNSLDETAFHIERCEGSGCTNFGGVGTQSADVATYTDSSVATGRSYTYRVRAYNSGGYSPYSSVASIVTPQPPVAPTGLTATALTRSSIGLRWTNGTASQLWVRIERCTGSGCTSFVQVAALAGTATTFTDNGLAARTTYRYRVRANSALGDSSYSNIASARTR